jgi:hypothetical protein
MQSPATRTPRPTSTRLPPQPTSTPEPPRPTATPEPRYSAALALPSASNFEFDGEFRANDWEQCDSWDEMESRLTPMERRDADIEAHEGNIWVYGGCSSRNLRRIGVEVFVSADADSATILAAYMITHDTSFPIARTTSGAEYDSGTEKLDGAIYTWSTVSSRGASATQVNVLRDRVVAVVVVIKPKPLTSAQIRELAESTVQRIDRARY